MTLQSIVLDRRLHYYQCCPQPFVQLIYSFTLRRRVAFFAFVLILPSVLLSMLTLVVFCLPHDSTDKINIGKRASRRLLSAARHHRQDQHR